MVKNAEQASGPRDRQDILNFSCHIACAATFKMEHIGFEIVESQAVRNAMAC